MRYVCHALVITALLGCAGPLSPGAISCQPYGDTPAPIAFSFPPGPSTAAQAEATAVALFRACQLPTITDITWTSEAGTGSRGGPNAGRAVWIVKVEATVPTSPAEGYDSHFWIEVNQATGVPTLIAYG